MKPLKIAATRWIAATKNDLIFDLFSRFFQEIDVKDENEPRETFVLSQVVLILPHDQ